MQEYYQCRGQYLDWNTLHYILFPYHISAHVSKRSIHKASSSCVEAGIRLQCTIFNGLAIHAVSRL